MTTKRSPVKAPVPAIIWKKEALQEHPAIIDTVPEPKHGEYDVFYPNRREELSVDLPDAPPAGTLARKTSEPLRALFFDGKIWHGRKCDGWSKQ